LQIALIEGVFSSKRTEMKPELVDEKMGQLPLLFRDAGYNTPHVIVN